ncbi:type II secretion system F family protein [Mycobacterium sp. 1274756.6]|uniref:type II secretion system F family protein n=1 Tax=Mycobacterium sp. 1274756.6 TaxID=1834076 RepID=UPI0008011A44|nr:type II secretion system F family protein [Mycobacterium sp. 1274756.6]OBJ70640.1 pilus assembly protein TadC [Mycobacterium sp. 1274756.6]
MTPLLLLAAALLSGGRRAPTRLRPNTAAAQPLPKRRGRPSVESLAVAASLEVLAACLSAGMTVAGAAAATAPSAPAALAQVLQRAADLLALGAAPDTAWSTPPSASDPQIDALVRWARRSTTSGTALADGIVELAGQFRREAADTAHAAAERAGVLIAGPLGLCFLPAFVCLGIIPMVIGLAGEVVSSGLL